MQEVARRKRTASGRESSPAPNGTGIRIGSPDEEVSCITIRAPPYVYYCSRESCPVPAACMYSVTGKKQYLWFDPRTSKPCLMAESAKLWSAICRGARPLLVFNVLLHNLYMMYLRNQGFAGSILIIRSSFACAQEFHAARGDGQDAPQQEDLELAEPHPMDIPIVQVSVEILSQLSEDHSY
jgi:hypothetical protein